MYTPAHFADTDPKTLLRIVQTHPFGTLVTQTEAGLDANHLPFEFEPDSGAKGTLLAHVARANPVWQNIAPNSPVLVIFKGANAYISPNWYPSKHEKHEQVPTWNYEVAHAHGRMSVHDDERYVRSVVAKLTRRHEAGEPVPWRMGDAPTDYLDRMLQAIVGIEIEVLRWEVKTKLSQNKTEADRENAAKTLSERGIAELAHVMRP